MIQKIRKAFSKAKTMKVALMAALVSMLAAPAASASSGPNTGNSSIDTVLSEMTSGFETAENAFVYLAIAAVAVTVIVVLFFWLRGKFKQAVSGA